MIHFEQVFDKAYFTATINAIFEDLAPAQAMFGSASEAPNVSDLLDAATSIVAFDLSFSAGIKADALSVFSSGIDTDANLFFRLNDLGVFAEATIASVDLDIFPGISVSGGDFLLSAGVRVAGLIEGEVTNGSMASGISFSHSLTNTAFDAYGKLAASLPFEATMNGATQKLAIKFEDDNLFDAQKLLVKVDIPVCSVLPLVNGLLGKLGSVGLSPRTILGNVDMSGLDLGDTLDDYFPNVEPFIDGILEGTNSRMFFLPAGFHTLIFYTTLIILSVMIIDHAKYRISQQRNLPHVCRGFADWRRWSNVRRFNHDAHRRCA